MNVSMGGKRKSSMRGSSGHDKKYKSRDLDAQSVGSASTKSDQDFKVDKILDRRIVRGKTEYLCTWKGVGSYEPTWEREDELDCEDLIDDYNDNLARYREDDDDEIVSPVSTATINGKGGSGIGIRENGSGRSHVVSSSTDNFSRISSSSMQSQKQSSNKGKISGTGTGFDRGLQAEFILGHSKSDTGERMFLIKWKDTEEADMVPARVANRYCPHLVINFFESRTELRNGQLIFR